MVLVWGFSFVAIRIALESVSAWELVVLRFLPVLLIFGPVALVLVRRRNTRFRGREWAVLFILGLFAVIGYNLSLNTGETLIHASFAALVIALNPTTITIIAAIFLREKPSPRTWIGLALGFTGIAIVIFGRNATPELRLSTLLGVLVTLGAPLSWGIYTAGLRYYAPKMGATTISTVTMSLGSLPLLLAIDKPLIGKTISGPPELMFSVLFLSIACTIYGFWMWAIILKRTEAAKAGMFIYLVPIVAAAGGHFVLGEPLDPPFFLGGVLVLSGVIYATRR